LPNRLERQKTTGPGERWSEFSFKVSRQTLENPEAMAALRANYRPTAYFFSGDPDPNCQAMQAVSTRWREIRDAALLVSERSLFYLTPTLGDELLDAPSCLMPFLKHEMEALAGDKTRVVTLDREQYGLQLRDFAFTERAERPDEISIDISHPNVFGARKITNYLAGVWWPL
jgi:hypothetical protein